jgi:hypothetical protein
MESPVADAVMLVTFAVMQLASNNSPGPPSLSMVISAVQPMSLLDGSVLGSYVYEPTGNGCGSMHVITVCVSLPWTSQSPNASDVALAESTQATHGVVLVTPPVKVAVHVPASLSLAPVEAFAGQNVEALEAFDDEDDDDDEQPTRRRKAKMTLRIRKT